MLAIDAAATVAVAANDACRLSLIVFYSCCATFFIDKKLIKYGSDYWRCYFQGNFFSSKKQFYFSFFNKTFNELASVVDNLTGVSFFACD